MIKLIISAIYFAIALGAAGTLVESTVFMGREAAKAHQIGLISLQKLNRALTGK